MVFITVSNERVSILLPNTLFYALCFRKRQLQCDGVCIPVYLQEIEEKTRQGQSITMVKVLLLLPHPIVLVEIIA